MPNEISRRTLIELGLAGASVAVAGAAVADRAARRTAGSARACRRRQDRLRGGRPGQARARPDHPRPEDREERQACRRRQRRSGQGKAHRGGERPARRRDLQLHRLRPHGEGPAHPGRSTSSLPNSMHAEYTIRALEGRQACAVRKADGDQCRRLRGDDRCRASRRPQADDRLSLPLRAAEPGRRCAGCVRARSASRASSPPIWAGNRPCPTRPTRGGST